MKILCLLIQTSASNFLFLFSTYILPRDRFIGYSIWQSILVITLDEPINVGIVFVQVKRELEQWPQRLEIHGIIFSNKSLTISQNQGWVSDVLFCKLGLLTFEKLECNFPCKYLGELNLQISGQLKDPNWISWAHTQSEGLTGSNTHMPTVWDIFGLSLKYLRKWEDPLSRKNTCTTIRSVPSLCFQAIKYAWIAYKVLPKISETQLADLIFIYKVKYSPLTPSSDFDCYIPRKMVWQTFFPGRLNNTNSETENSFHSSY